MFESCRNVVNVSLDGNLEEVALFVGVLMSEPEEAETALGTIAAEAGCAALRGLSGQIILLGDFGEGISRQGLFVLNWGAGIRGAGDQGEEVGRAAGPVCVERHGGKEVVW